MITSAGLIPEELYLNLVQNINRKIEENSLIRYMNPISVDNVQICVPIEHNPYKTHWGGEIIDNIETVKNEITKHVFALKKMYINVKCSYESLASSNVLFSYIEQKVITSMVKEENYVIVNGARESNTPMGLIGNKTCKKIESEELSDMFIKMFTDETNLLFSYSDISDYIWITTHVFLQKILNDNLKTKNNLIVQSKDEYKLMGLTIKVVDKINSENIDIILVNLKTNYMLLRKDDSLQMKRTEYATHMELFFHKSMDGASIYSHGLVFGKFTPKAQ
jgi:HK97 family phage major capsid protein